MNLLKALLMIFVLWRPAFCKQAAFIRARTVLCMPMWIWSKNHYKHGY
jgi:hypothetical protein